MLSTAIHTRAIVPPQDDLLAVIDAYLPQLDERSVVAVSSKVVAIWQGRCVKMDDKVLNREQRRALVEQEADLILPPKVDEQHMRYFTIRDGVLGSSAGIDASNGNGYFVLLPEKCDDAAKQIRAHLVKRDGLTELGVVITDSRSAPLRNGVTGIALGHAGFHALFDYRGSKDIFGRTLVSERMNAADCLATAATLMMGEGDESTPFVTFTDVPHVVFGDTESGDIYLNKSIPQDLDVFKVFLGKVDWKHGKRHTDNA